MVNYKIELAGKVIAIQNIYADTFKRCSDFITAKPAEIEVTITEADIENECKKSISEALYEGVETVLFPAYELESTATYRKIAEALIPHNIAVFHGAVVAVGDEAYLFTAKSGTGKTTHINLWLENIPGTYVVNGDKPLLIVDNESVYACGSPWAGKEGMFCNKIVPLKAICILERGEQNRIERITRKEAFPMLMQQIYRSPSQMADVMRLASDIGGKTALYRLSCNMEPEAAQVSYKGMNE